MTDAWNDKVSDIVTRNIVKKGLEMFAEIAEKKDDHKRLYKKFDKCMKLATQIPPDH